MTDADKGRFSDLMTFLGIAIGVPVDDPMRATYWHFLKDLAADDFEKACNRAGMEMKFFPKPAELRKLAGIIPLADRGEEAWSVVRSAMDRLDYTNAVDFGPIANAAIRQVAGTWTQLCDQSLPDLVWTQKRFVEAFALLATNPPDADRGRYLAGLVPGAPFRVLCPGGLEPRPMLENAASARVSRLVTSLADSKS